MVNMLPMRVISATVVIAKAMSRGFHRAGTESFDEKRNRQQRPEQPERLGQRGRHEDRDYKYMSGRKMLSPAQIPRHIATAFAAKQVAAATRQACKINMDGSE